MDKKEIQNKLEQAKVDKFEINKQVQVLEQKLREAEKPKLRHGDFGLDYAKNPCIRIRLPGKTTIAVADKDRTYGNDVGVVAIPKIIIGNIFDLLKEWSEDLEVWERPTGHNKFVFKICGCTIDFHTNSYCSFNLPEAEEIWHKLGQMIATLKRKNPQE